MNTLGTIYKIENKHNHHTYIGQTIQPVEARWRSHISSSVHMTTNFKINQAIRKYGVESFDFSVIETVPIEKLDEREKYWIEQMDTYHHGYNGTSGGRGVYSRGDDSKRSCQVCQYSLDGEYIARYKSAAEACRVTGVDSRGILRCVNGNLNQSGGYQWKKPSDPPPDRLGSKSKSVTQYSMNLEPIRTFDSIAEASSSTGIHQSNIITCCKGRSKSCGGFIWAYSDATTPSKYNNAKHRKVSQYGKDGELIATFSSIAEAARRSGAAPSQISMCCSHQARSAGGYVWKYAEQEDCV